MKKSSKYSMFWNHLRWQCLCQKYCPWEIDNDFFAMQMVKLLRGNKEVGGAT